MNFPATLSPHLLLAIHRPLAPVTLVPDVRRVRPLGQHGLPPPVQIDARDGEVVSDLGLAHHFTLEPFAQTGVYSRRARPAGLDVSFRLQAEGALLLIEEDVIRDQVYGEVVDDAGFESPSAAEDPLTGFLRALRIRLHRAFMNAHAQSAGESATVSFGKERWEGRIRAVNGKADRVFQTDADLGALLRQQRLVAPVLDLRANDLVFAFDDALIPLLRRPGLSLIVSLGRRAFCPRGRPGDGPGSGWIGGLRSDQPPDHALEVLAACVASARRDAEGPIRRVQEQREVVGDRIIALPELDRRNQFAPLVDQPEFDCIDVVTRRVNLRVLTRAANRLKPVHRIDSGSPEELNAAYMKLALRRNRCR